MGAVSSVLGRALLPRSAVRTRDLADGGRDRRVRHPASVLAARAAPEEDPLASRRAKLPGGQWLLNVSLASRWRPGARDPTGASDVSARIAEPQIGGFRGNQESRRRARRRCGINEFRLLSTGLPTSGPRRLPWRVLPDRDMGRGALVAELGAPFLLSHTVASPCGPGAGSIPARSGETIDVHVIALGLSPSQRRRRWRSLEDVGWPRPHFRRLCRAART
jgi:hypothetical protein